MWLRVVGGNPQAAKGNGKGNLFRKAIRIRDYDLLQPKTYNSLETYWGLDLILKLELLEVYNNQ